jgi:hypothetical protein
MPARKGEQCVSENCCRAVYREAFLHIVPLLSCAKKAKPGMAHARFTQSTKKNLNLCAVRRPKF